MMMKPETFKYRLKKGYQRCQVAVQELDQDVVVEADKVFETTHPGVARELDRQPALERAAATKGGD